MKRTQIFGSIVLSVVSLLAVFAFLIAGGFIGRDPVKITVATLSKEAYYNGEALTCDEWKIVSGEIDEDHTIKVEFTGTQTEVGQSPNYAVIKIFDENNADVTDTYDITEQLGTLTVKARSIEIKAKDATKEYDGEVLMREEYEILTGTFLAGHTPEITVSGEITEVGSVSNVVTVSIVRNREGEDVSRNYAFTCHHGTLTVTPRLLTVQTASYEKVYDGTPLVGEEDGYEVLSGTVADGQNLTVNITGSQTNAGESENTFSATVTDADGNDVTKNYTVTPINGTLNVYHREITVKTGDIEGEYDGNPLVCEDYEITEGELVEGHVLTVTFTKTAVNVSTVKNEFTYDIVDEEGNDVAFNYAVTKIDGEITVYPRNITVKSGSAKKEYDGTPLKTEPDDYEITDGEIVEGHILEVDIVGERTSAGSSSNTFAVYVYDADGNEISRNYKIQTIYGELEVTKRAVGFSSGDFTKQFDGTPLLGNAEGCELVEGELVQGHTWDVVSAVGSVTEVGISAKNTLRIAIKNEAGEDVSHNYEFTDMYYGLLAVTPRPISIESGSASKTYDGTPLTFDFYEVVSALDVIDGHTLEVTVTGSTVEAGYAPNTFTVIVTDGDGNDVSSDYDITKIQGFLTVDKREVIVSTESANKIYDGTPLTNTKNPVVAGIVSGHNVIADFTGTQTLAGSSQNTCSVIITDGDGRAVTYNYTFTYSFGTLNVEKRIVTVRSGDASKVYDGTPLTCNEYSVVSELNVVNGHTLKVVISGTRTEVGESYNDIASISVSDAQGRDVSSNYDFSYMQEGKLVVTSNTVVNSYGKVFTNSNDSVYLRNFSYGDYYGNVWSIDATEYNGLLSGGYGMLYLTGAALAGSGYTADNVQIQSYTDMYLLATYMSMSGGSYDIQESDVYSRGSTEEVYSHGYYSFDSNDLSSLSGVPAEYAAAEQAYRNFVYENYLSVPITTKNYLQTLINQNGFSKGDSDVIQAVAAFIRGSAEYDLDCEALDKESDIVISFLRDYKRGVCRHYASAATLMYRTLGIPARYTEGFLVNTVGGKWVDITEDRAHAWVEVYVDGIGWVQVEVTGGFGSSDYKPTVKIGLNDLEKEYDGTPLKPEKDTAINSPDLERLVADGYTFTVTFTGEQTYVGESEYQLKTIVIYDKNGSNATDRFKILVDESATLTVYSYDTINITLKNLSKEYDGETLVPTVETAIESEELMTLLSLGYKVQVVFEGSQTVIGESDYWITDIKLYDPKGDNVTDSFEINVLNTGKLKVYAPTEIKIKLKPLTKQYDGTPLEPDTESAISSDALNTLATLEYTYTAVFEGSQTEVGVSQYSMLSITIYNELGIDVTLNFTITVDDTNAQLIVTERPAVLIELLDLSKPYDGTPLVPTKETAFYSESLEQMVQEGYTYDISFTGSQTEIGESNYYVESFVLYDSLGEDVTENFVIQILEPAILRVYDKEPFEIRLVDLSKEYDGTPLVPTKETAIISKGLFSLVQEGYTYEVTFEGSQTEIGVSEYILTKLVIYDQNREDVTDKFPFVVTNTPATLEVLNPDRLVLLLADLYVEYTGEPYTPVAEDAFRNCHDLQELLEKGFTYEAVFYGEQTVVGSSVYGLISFNLFKDGEDVTEQFDIDMTKAGMIYIYKYPTLMITLTDIEKVYDGTPLVPTKETALTGGEWKTFLDGLGFTYTATFEGSQTEVGQSEYYLSTFNIFDTEGNDVTVEFTLNYSSAYLRVLLSADVDIALNDIQKEYDGTPLVPTGELAIRSEQVDYMIGLGYTFYFEFSGSRTEIGRSEYYLTSVTVIDRYGVDVTEYFKVTKQEYAYLEVTMFTDVEVTLVDLEKEYDGTPLIPTKETALKGDRLALLEGLGYTCYVEFNGSQTEVGESMYSVTVFKILNGRGEDVTGEFNITVSDYAMLTVYFDYDVEINLKVLTKIYDGTPLIPTVEDGVESEDLEKLTLYGYTYSITLEGSQTEVGTSPYTITEIIIYNALGEDVTGLFNVTFEPGTLVVSERPAIYVKLEKLSKTYDGTPLEPTRETALISDGLDALVREGYTFGIKFVGSQTEVGESKYYVERFELYDASGEDVTDQYTVIFDEKSTLTVYKHDPLVITLLNLEKVYDGEPLIPTAETAVLCNLEEYLREGGYLLAFVFDGSQTEVGESRYTVVSVTITDAFGEDVTEEFRIYYDNESAKLTVKAKIQLYISLNEIEKVYDGEPLIPTEEKAFEMSTAIADLVKLGYTFKAEFEGSQTEVGESEYTVTEFLLYDENGEDISARYDITFAPGILRVVKYAPIIITLDDIKKVYDGTPLLPTAEFAFGDSVWQQMLAELGFEYTVQFEGSQTEVGESDYFITYFAIFDAEDNEITDEFEISFDEKGKLTVIEDEGNGDGEDGGGEDGGENGDGENGDGEEGGGENGGSGSGTDLDDSGNISSPDNMDMEELKKIVVAKILAEYSGKAYLRYTSFGDYEGNKWSTPTEYTELIDGIYSMLYLSGLALENSGYTPYSMEITSNSNDYLLAYYYAMGEYAYEIQSGEVRGVGSTELPYTFGHYVFDYSMLGTVDGLPSRYAAAELAYRNFVYQNYLNLPAGTNAYLQSVIQSNGFDASDANILSKVASYIMNVASYNSDYDRSLDDSEDVVVAFMRDYKQGICQHYASAATLLFRALGIPARYTIGYVTDVIAGESVELTADRAHAWVEVYIDGFGWVQVEVTGSARENVLEIELQKISKVYDGTPLVPTKETAINSPALNYLVANGYTYIVEFTGTQTEIGVSPYGVSDFRLISPDGVNVTDYYRIRFTGEAVLEVYENKIEIALETFTKRYDGTPLVPDTETAVISPDLEALVAQGYTYDISFSGSQTEIGTSDYRVEAFTLYDSDGNDVTSEYTLYYSVGKLIVTENPPIYIALNDLSKVYDGTPLVPTKETAVKSETLDVLSEEGYTYEITFNGSQTEIGTSEYTVESFVLYNADGVDVTGLFSVNYAESGKLEVYTDKILNLTLAKISKLYVGESLVPTGEEAFRTCSDLLALLDEGYTYIAEFEGELTEVGTAPYTLKSFTLYDENLQDVTAYYNITCSEQGILELYVYDKMYIVLNDLSKTYDGTPLIPDKETAIASDAMIKLESEGYTFSFEFEGSQTEIGESRYYVKNCVITDVNGFNVTKGFDITVEEYATLTVHKYDAIAFKLENLTKTYDGEPLIPTEDTAITGNPVWMTMLQKLGFSYEITFNGSQTAIGRSTYSAEIFRVFDADGADVTEEFRISIEDGTLTVLPSTTINYTLKDLTKVYDGTPLVPTKETAIESEDLEILVQAGYTFGVTFNGSQTEIGESGYSVVGWVIRDASGRVVTDDFEFKGTTYAALRVISEATEITFELSKIEKLYDGTPLVPTVEKALNNCKVYKSLKEKNYTVEVTFQGSQTEVGTSKYAVTDIRIFNSKGEDITHLYHIDVDAKKADLRVYKYDLHLTSKDVSYVYDGKEHKDTELLKIEGLQPNHFIESVVFVGKTSVGKAQNIFDITCIRDENGEDVTYLYKVWKSYGDMEITGLDITVKSADARKAYDGTPLTCEEYEIVEGALCEGHRLVISITGSQTNIGYSENTIDIYNVRIYDENNVDVTANYTIKFIVGMLMVTPK